MSQLNDEILRVTGGPIVNDGLSVWYSRTSNESLQDAEYRWLVENGATSAHINDMWREVLLGAGYEGSLNDQLYLFWVGGGTLAQWILNLDGTNYMELSEPKTFAGSSSAEFPFKTNGGVLQDFTDGYSITAGDVFSTPAEVIDILIDGASIGLGGPAPTDGQKHTVKFLMSSMSLKNNVGANNANGNKFQGVIYSDKFTDLSGAQPNPNSISHDIKAGPPIYVNGDPAQGTISDGTIYQESNEYGTEADIMRADDWGNISDPVNVSVSGKVASFSGAQTGIQSATINNNEQYSKYHFIVYKVYGESQGSVRVRTGLAGGLFKTSGVHAEYLDCGAGNSIYAQSDSGGGFDGSVEIISVKPVPEGLVMQEVDKIDWSQE